MRLFRQPAWGWRAREAMDDQDQNVRFQGYSVAKRLGLVTEDVIVRQLRRDPTDERVWTDWCWGKPEATVDRALALAMELWDLPALASGPGTELGFGPQFALHRCAEVLIAQVDRFPGTGRDLLLATLRSPLVRNRLGALRALASWHAGSLDGDLLREVAARRDDDPVERVRAQAAELLARAGRSP